MPWWYDLSPEEHRRLLRLGFPTPDDAAAATIEDPRYAEECAQFGLRVTSPATTEHRGRHVAACVVVPQEYEAVLLALVREAQLESDGGDGGGVDEPPTEVELADLEPDLSGRPLPAAAVLDALRAFASGTSIQEVGKDKSIDLSYRGARRVFSWHKSGAVRWDRTQKKFRVAARYSLVTSGTETNPKLQLVRI